MLICRFLWLRRRTVGALQAECEQMQYVWKDFTLKAKDSKKTFDRFGR